MIEGSSIDPAVVDQVKAQIKPGESVLVLLEFQPPARPCGQGIELYSPLVSAGS
jgi:cephalosporin hydroxylase